MGRAAWRCVFLPPGHVMLCWSVLAFRSKRIKSKSCQFSLLDIRCCARSGPQCVPLRLDAPHSAPSLLALIDCLKSTLVETPKAPPSIGPESRKREIQREEGEDWKDRNKKERRKEGRKENKMRMFTVWLEGLEPFPCDHTRQCQET